MADGGAAPRTRQRSKRRRPRPVVATVFVVLVAAVVSGPLSVSPAAAAPASVETQPTGTAAIAPAASPLGAVRIAHRGIAPRGITRGPDGNVWFANTGHDTIGKITPSGAITQYPTTGITGPSAISGGPDGNLWFVSYADHKIGRMTPAGSVTVFTAAGLDRLNEITSGPDGNLWFTQQGNQVGRVTTSGAVTLFPHQSIANPRGITAGSDGNLWFTNAGSIGRITPSGVVTSYTTDFIAPGDVALGSDGNVWFTSRYVGHSYVGRVTPAGAISTFTAPTIQDPLSITAGPDGALWFTNNTTIGRITTAGSVSDVGDVGSNGELTAGADGNLWLVGVISVVRMTTSGQPTAFTGSGVALPRGIAYGPDGNFWFVNWTNIGRMTPAGVITYFPVPGAPSVRAIVAGPDGNLWFTDPGNQAIGRITPSGVVTEYPGATFPEEIVAGADGNLWFTVSYLPYAAIGKVTTGGQITLFNFHNVLKSPFGLAWGPDGNIWVADRDGDQVGRMTPAGALTRFTDSTIAGPTGISAGPDGALWFTNANGTSSSIGRITTSGSVAAFSHPGVYNPFKILAGPDGALWFGNGHDDIGRVTPSGDFAFYAVPSTASSVYGLVNGPDGDVWFTDYGAALIGAVGTRTVPQRFFGLTPKRVLDSRDGTGTYQSPWFWAQTRDITVAGGTTTVPANATAVVLNVAGVGASNSTHLTVWPTGVTMPVASNLNLPPGGVRANLVTVKVGYQGKVSISNNAGLVDVVGDVVGYYAADDTGSLYNAVTPKRLLDSRDGTGGFNSPWGGGQTRELAVTGGSSTVAADATAVVLNMTVTGGSAASHLTVWPSGAAMPVSSNLNFAAGATVPNLVVVKVGTGGKVSIFNNAGNVHVIADVVGFYRVGGGSAFNGLSPKRLLDSRDGTGGFSTPWTGGLARSLTVAGGSSGVPPNATAVVLNLTGVGPSTGTHLTVWPAGSTMPVASNLNLPTGDVRPNLVMVKVGVGGHVSIFNNAGTVHVLADVVGYFV